uniref:Flavodoxin-like fold domain-containing protein n=1 Tax=Kryptolebias marmoratus TaxID=37003 RepID=A0A3Q3B669_KRYMA
MVLIIYAHQSSGSFNAAAKNAAVEVLTAQGCTVEVSDLYAMNFKATATAEDIKGDVKNAENFCYLEESRIAWEEGRLSDDITKEQTKIAEADMIIFQDKKAMLSFTTGSLESMFSPTGINGDMNVTLWPLQNGILNYCGFQVLAPQIFWAPALTADEDRKSMLEAWRTRLQGLLEEKPLSFFSLDCFDEKAFQLKPDVHEKHASKEFGLTVGIHLNKPLPPHSQMKLLLVTHCITGVHLVEVSHSTFSYSKARLEAISFNMPSNVLRKESLFKMCKSTCEGPKLVLT